MKPHSALQQTSRPADPQARPPAPLQPDLFTAGPAPDGRDVQWLIDYLRSRDWTLAANICRAIGQCDAKGVVNENQKRWVRGLADRSLGKISSGQRGYKLTLALTGEEYQTARNTLAHQAAELQRRVVEMDHVWYARQPVHASIA